MSVRASEISIRRQTGLWFKNQSTSQLTRLWSLHINLAKPVFTLIRKGMKTKNSRFCRRIRQKLKVSLSEQTWTTW